MEVARNWELSSKIPWETGRYGMFEKTWGFSGFPVWWDSSLEVTNYLVGWVVNHLGDSETNFIVLIMVISPNLLTTYQLPWATSNVQNEVFVEQQPFDNLSLGGVRTNITKKNAQRDLQQKTRGWLGAPCWKVP